MGWNEADLAECTPEFLSAIIKAIERRNKQQQKNG
jgi:hypothetical protein